MLSVNRAFTNFFNRRFSVPILNVVQNGVVEEHTVLRYNSNRFSEAGQWYSGDVLAIDSDLATLGIKKSVEQSDDGWLPRPRTSNKSDLFARWDVKAQRTKNGRIARHITKFKSITKRISLHKSKSNGPYVFLTLKNQNYLKVTSRKEISDCSGVTTNVVAFGLSTTRLRSSVSENIVCISSIPCRISR